MLAHQPSLFRAVSHGVVLLLAAVFSGCASYTRIAEYPTPQQGVTVDVASKPMSKMSELPVGAYYDEPRHIIVTGHQKGVFAGMLFGIVGVVVADQMNKASGSDKFGATASKGADLGSLLSAAIDASITNGQAARWSRDAKGAGLQLTPYAVFTVEKDGQARLHAMLRAEIPGRNGEPAWSVRYFARAPGSHPLTEAGWMAEDRFSNGMRAALERVVQVCIDDTHGRLSGAKTVTAKGKYPYIGFDIELRAITVQEQPNYLVARLALGDAAVLAGTHVLDRADYEIKTADFKDPRK